VGEKGKGSKKGKHERMYKRNYYSLNSKRSFPLQKISMVRVVRDQGWLELPECSEYTGYSTVVVRVR